MKFTFTHFILIAMGVLTVGCNKRVEKLTKLNINQDLEGEWLDSSDTVNGISVRGDKIAFFKNGKFSISEMNEYQIIDSIYKTEDSEKKIGEYLLIKDYPDSLLYKIIKRDKKSILLSDSKQNQKEYKFWR